VPDVSGVLRASRDRTNRPSVGTDTSIRDDHAGRGSYINYQKDLGISSTDEYAEGLREDNKNFDSWYTTNKATLDKYKTDIDTSYNSAVDQMSKIPKTVNEGVETSWNDFEKGFVNIVVYKNGDTLPTIKIGTKTQTPVYDIYNPSPIPQTPEPTPTSITYRLPREIAKELKTQLGSNKDIQMTDWTGSAAKTLLIKANPILIEGGIKPTSFVDYAKASNYVFAANGAEDQNPVGSLTRSLTRIQNDLYKQFYTASVPKITEQLAGIYKQFGEAETGYNKGLTDYNTNLDKLTSAQNTRANSVSNIKETQDSRSQAMEDVLANIQF
jgi:hypothetical protein